MTVLVPELVKALATSRDAFWAGALPPRFNMTASTTIYDPEADFREPAERHQNFDMVFLVERDLASIKQWPLVLDEALRLLRPGGLLIVRMRQGHLLSLFQLANYITKWTHRHVELVWQGFAGPDFTLIVRFTEVERRRGWEGFAFGLITDGRKPDAVQAFVESVLAMDEVAGLDREIIVCGPVSAVRDLGSLAAHISLIEQPAAFQAQGWITRKKNLIVERARSGHVLVAHDRYRVHPDFLTKMDAFGPDFDILVPRQETEDGQRIPDWVTTRDALNWSRPGWLDYGDYHPNLYVNGGVTIGRTATLRRVPWNELLFWNEAEDVELTRRLQDDGVTPRLARSVRLMTGAMRPGLIEGFERLPWRRHTYAATTRPDWLPAPEDAPAPPYRARTRVDLADADIGNLADRYGLIIPCGWEPSPTGIAWNAVDEPVLSLRLEGPAEDLVLVLTAASGPPVIAHLIVNTVRLPVPPPEPGSAELRIAIPASAVPDSGMLHLQFERGREPGLQLASLLLAPVARPTNLDFDVPVQINADGAAQFPRKGWYGPESWGMWSIGRSAEVTLRLPSDAAGDLRLFLGLRGFVAPVLPDLVIGVTVNAIPVGMAVFTASSKDQELAFDIPAALAEGGELVLGFEASRLASPRSIGESADERLLAMGLMRVMVSRKSAPPASAESREGAQVELDAPVLFSNAQAAPYLGSGWHSPEDFGTWSAARSASLCLRLPAAGPGDLRLCMSLRGFVAPELTDLLVQIFINDTLVGEARFTVDASEQDVDFGIPAGSYGDGVTVVRFELSRQVSPWFLGRGEDRRMLGIALLQLVVSQA